MNYELKPLEIIQKYERFPPVAGDCRLWDVYCGTQLVAEVREIQPTGFSIVWCWHFHSINIISKTSGHKILQDTLTEIEKQLYHYIADQIKSLTLLANF